MTRPRRFIPAALFDYVGYDDVKNAVCYSADIIVTSKVWGLIWRSTRDVRSVLDVVLGVQ
jgi:hypothetical protein